MFFDSHVHSAASPDSEMMPQEAIAALKKAGLGIAFTEHVDFVSHPSRNPNATDVPRGVGDFICDFEIYPSQYKQFRGEGVMLGLELGLTKAFSPANKELADGDYDFILGSVHIVDGVELYFACNGTLPQEPFSHTLQHAPHEAISRYLRYAAEVVEQDDFFDSFGHIDYISRYLPQLAQEFSYANFTAEFDALFRTLAQQEIALEINTCLLGEDLAAQKMFDICRRFAQLGGRLCTIGSDAHNVSALGRNFKCARKIAEESGLAVVYFKERKPVRCGK
ncbi:MAG: histidinol-phosphatase HisJ family protein [Defluviitaleaceae bacterium]|nr:histidinol-phosphatase HisJ family protein [Defluviitaleaceae bacterium]MCL2261870.1 histidinol-phosphatase HisJ family protein [Defluviitaleaceae bacterium]